jgi:hypothetical protein
VIERKIAPVNIKKEVEHSGRRMQFYLSAPDARARRVSRMQ